MIITGIGTRNVPADALGVVDQRLVDLVSQIGAAAKSNGWTLRSGGADGMDSLFEFFWGKSKEIYIPWQGFNNRYHGVNGAVLVQDPLILSQATPHAKGIHPRWSALRSGGKNLHTRNVFQVLGEHLIEPSDACVYYADINYNGEVQGGTRTAVMLSQKFGIPTFNLKMTAEIIELEKLLE